MMDNYCDRIKFKYIEAVYRGFYDLPEFPKTRAARCPNYNSELGNQLVDDYISSVTNIAMPNLHPQGLPVYAKDYAKNKFDSISSTTVHITFADLSPFDELKILRKYEALKFSFDLLISSNNQLIVIEPNPKLDINLIYHHTMCTLAIYNSANTPIQIFSIVLPLHRIEYTFECPDLTDLADYLVYRYYQECVRYFAELTLEQFNIGTHTDTGGNPATALANYANLYPGMATQIFLAPSRTGVHRVYSNSEIENIRQVIANNNMRVYIHSAYNQNLCNARMNRESVIRDLNLGLKIGAKGVVLHTGTATDKQLTLSQSIQVMENNVRFILRNHTGNCLLLLETPVGEGNEVGICTSRELMQEFISRFTDTEKSKLGICVDTCHVFASGHAPNIYIRDWNNVVPIALIHFNDSKHAYYSRRDQHAIPGQGLVGADILFHCANIAHQLRIDMVGEP